MAQRNNVLLRELADLLSQLSFTEERADLREGAHWSVYAHPWVGEEEGYFDALISVTPLQSGAGTCQGLRLTVHSGNTTWLADGVTNKRGQAWFKQLPVGLFNARLASISIPMETDEEEELSGVPLMKRMAAASPAGRETRRSEPCIFYLSDRRVVALLEEGLEGQAVLTLETEASELAGATVRFEIDQEKGEVTLTPTDPPGAWGGQHFLRQSFRAVKTYVPTFELVPPQQKEGVSKQ